MGNFIENMELKKEKDFHRNIQALSEQAKYNKALEIMIMLKNDEYDYVTKNDDDSNANVINYIRDLYSRINATIN